MAESAAAGNTAETPQRKRGGGKRTARACDECRLRKAKCDGLSPCEACQNTDRYCTYNLSAARGTSSGTRIRILEDRLRRARAYLNEAQRRTPSLANVNFDALLGPVNEASGREPRLDADPDDDDSQGRLDSMMDSYGQMTMDTNGSINRNFYGAASGLAWIQRTKRYFEDSDSDGSGEAEDTAGDESTAVQLFDASLPLRRSSHVDSTVSELLPPGNDAIRLLETVVKQVYPMFHFLCEEDFQESMTRIYDLHPSQYEEQDQCFLPVFYLVMGLGYLFSKEDHESLGCRTAVAQGMRYFMAARDSMDFGQLRTMTNLQCVVGLILFLISTARMASAHAFLGAACASAMGQGLHFRSSHDISLSVREKRVRRRIFWAVMNLDMYISSILGLPPFMDFSAVDPAIDLTIEVALREAKTDAHLSSADKLALAASAKHIELMRIRFKAQAALFPKPADPPGAEKRNGTISVSVAKLQKVEDQFRAWAESLTDILSHPNENIETQSIKYEIKICYYFAQIVLYRAFLHYLANEHEDESVGQRQLSYARTCVEMAKKVVEVSIEHHKRGLLCPASWISVYTVFVGAVCLIFAYATRRKDTSAPETKTDIENAIRLLACTACTTDTGSVRCLEVLRRLIKRVSYAVDVDLDDICAHIQPCCTTNFSPFPQPTGVSLEELQIPARSGPELSHSQASSMMHGQAGVEGDNGWRISHDVTTTRPSPTGVKYDLPQQGPQRQPPPYLQQDVKMMEVPYGGIFSWSQHDFHETAWSLGQPAEGSAGGYTSRPGGEQGPSNIQPPVSSEDIAAFMHINPVDEVFRFRERQDQ
ncbi:Gypsy retrotransposon integrase-like protein 1 [Exophiala xenobiotica]|uniref:Gypsy retrotransposon integrase-like protein 1 n=1 Tax=Lithohypha guttulata TaxID=1690604 RepID=A0ABR0JTB8_9EURO|nr:Gypsy retrotransposon integrase-like protein 1 [Lithohypha guttulata]KAK5308979.1 Gypsy retrotransposon integrase-like protein 1 [Exophiala xenobiotica]